MSDSSFSLLKTKRFKPFFITQFLGAFNDNLFKQALITIISFGAGAFSASNDLPDANTLNNIGAALFILPFFLFSALAGQFADKYEKSFLIQRVKLMEIVIMLGAAAAFMFKSLEGLLMILFFMGTQSAFFGPLKYSIMPQHLKTEELIQGNALVELGTFLAIIFGYIGGVLLAGDSLDPIWISSAVVFFAVLGWWNSRNIPEAEPADANLKIDWNIFRQSYVSLKLAAEERSVFLSIIGISWFWFLGAAYMTQLPIFVRDYLNGSEGVYVFLLTVFSVGIGLGSILCEKLSGKKVELGLVPLGSIGLSLFGIDLYFTGGFAGTAEITLAEFFKQDKSFSIIADFLGIGISGGLYIVPLFAIVQDRTDDSNRSRIIGANNILNAFLMVASAITGILLIGLAGLSIPEFFLVIALCNIACAVFIYTVVPEFTMRFIVWMLTHTIYRVKHIDIDKVPEEGACVLVCNHVSYADAMIIGGALRRPVRFVMYKPIYHMPVLNFIFRTGKAIPIDSKKNDPEAFAKAFAQIKEELDNGEVVCIFPEGKLTTDGEVDLFKSGIDKILSESSVPVVPMALKGLWGSVFSHKDGPALTTRPKRFWSKVDFVVGDPVPHEEASSQNLYEKVLDLRGEVVV